MPRMGFGGSAQVIREVLAQTWPLRPRELLQRGVSPAWIGMHPLVFIERLDRGVYGEKKRGYPRVVIVSARTDRSFACLYSALWLHGLIEEEPAEAWLCIGHKAWKPRGGLIPAQYVRTSLWPTRDQLCVLGRWQMPTTTLARTGFDFFRLRHRVGVAAAEAARKLILDSGKCSQEEIDACAHRSQSSKKSKPNGAPEE